MTTNHLRWALVAQDPALLADLEPLIQARRRVGTVQLCGSMKEALEAADCVLAVGGEVPQSAIIGARDGRRIPVGWVGAERDALRIFVRTAAQLISRQEQNLAPGPAILLAQGDDRALLLADEVEQACELPLLRWTAERVIRRDMLEGLRCGAGAVLYLGHALSGAWVGYGGVTAVALAARRMPPLGAVITIACDAAQCHRNRASFSDELIMRGACAAALGAVGKSKHETNRVLARSAARALSRARTLGELLLQVPEEVLQGYRIAGDPAAPFIGAAHALESASEVYAPVPEQLLETVAGARKYWDTPTALAQR
jgi:hypothetical protein